MLLQSQNNQNDSGHVFVMQSYLAVLWDRGELDHWMYQKVLNQNIFVLISGRLG